MTSISSEHNHDQGRADSQNSIHLCFLSSPEVAYLIHQGVAHLKTLLYCCCCQVRLMVGLGKMPLPANATKHMQQQLLLLQLLVVVGRVMVTLTARPCWAAAPGMTAQVAVALLVLEVLRRWRMTAAAAAAKIWRRSTRRSRRQSSS
jgi:hypothetical protein